MRVVLERAVSSLERGRDALAFSCGTAAWTSVLFLFGSGDHLLVSRDVSPGNRRLFSQAQRLGLDVTFVDTSDLECVVQSIRPRTRAIVTETPALPFFRVSDLRRLSYITEAYRLMLVVDNTLLTPLYQQPLCLGADLVLHRTARFLSGGREERAGFVVTNDEELAFRLKSLRRLLDAELDADASYRVLSGLTRMEERINQATRNAEKTALWLERHPSVRRVYYTGLPSHEGKALQELQASGHGSLLTFDVGEREKAWQLLRRTRVPVVAVSPSATDRLPFCPTFLACAEEGEGMLMLSVGTGPCEELIGDLARAMAGL
jgi:cystathionine beta-lyase